MPIVIQNARMPNTTDRTSPIEYLNEIVSTLMLQMMTHCANMHIPEETMSNMFPWVLMVSYIEMKVNVDKKKL